MAVHSSDRGTTITLAGPAPEAGGAWSRPLRIALWAGLGLVLVAAFVAVGLSRPNTAASGSLPVLGQAPKFSLVNQEGQPVSNADLLGQVWVADFIFTSCGGPCPVMSLNMSNLQKRLTDEDLEAKLVSFTLDPARDTPEVLARYARRFRADPGRWTFLTGPDERAVYEVVAKGFLQTITPATEDNPLIHSTYFAVVDRQGRIRAFHEGVAESPSEALIQDVRTLLSEPAGP